ncbi:hypothetical protein ENSA5_67020 [Enhygromyxa salina]|uniref:Pyrrolo-quinoline quinone repeat domain-containing protein n=1 Tax=Enhygromyxa salina TaxID=215803 RepID=A0A2S9XBK3_9BACT|nr:PQQ-binding-like beta-propeller repeat protein [Enhygromyxa salina]PRP90180.1 hypothetical protein ENSA5_67020 [Enhygromyxa salina]
MAIVKLVCQGCGANLDAMDDRRVIQCGYCGTTNQIKRTVHEQPRQAPPPPQPQTSFPPPPAQVNLPQAANAGGGAGRGVLTIILLTTCLPMLIGGMCTFMGLQTTSELLDGLGVGFEGSNKSGVNARKYGWNSKRPFVADVNGDGTDDIIGTITEPGSEQLLLTAMSGSDWSTLWEVDLGKRANLPNSALYFEPQSKLVLFGVGAALYAYDGGSGAERWVASLPDALEVVTVDGDHLWVATIDEAGHDLDLASGKVTPAASEPGAAVKTLRDDTGYELIPELGKLDLKYDQYDGLRVQQAFCPEQDLPFALGRRDSAEAKRCANPHGLAFATRDKGTDVPYLIGYDRGTKAETWRVQLTKAGSLETVDRGLGQPRAEYVGADAIVSFVPSSDNNARIRQLSLVDGSTKWETTLTRTSVENVDGMVVGDGVVFVKYGQRIHVLSQADGEELVRLGGLM